MKSKIGPARRAPGRPKKSVLSRQRKAFSPGFPSCKRRERMVKSKSVERYRSGYNGPDPKSCYSFTKNEYFLSGDVPKWLKGPHSKCGRSVDDPSPKTLDISGFSGLSTLFNN